MHLSVLYSTTPLQGNVGNKVGIWIVQSLNAPPSYWECQSVKSRPSPHPKDLNVGAFNYSTCIWWAVKFPMYGASFSVKTGQMPRLFPSIAQEGDSGAHIDRCITYKHLNILLKQSAASEGCVYVCLHFIHFLYYCGILLLKTFC